MKFCLNAITLGERPYPVAIEAAAKAGFAAVELWLPHAERYIAEGRTPAEARTVLRDNGLEAAGACFVAGLLTSTGEAKRKAFDTAKARFELCQELGAKTITCVGDGPAAPTMDDYHTAAEQAREIGDLAASFGLSVALEFIAGLPFIASLATAAKVVGDADHPHLGILLDCFHFWAGRSKMDDFARLRGAPIAFVHINDARDLPREILRDADRLLPGQGCLPLAQIVQRIQHSGYDGYYSLELFSPELAAAEPFEAAARCRQACERLAASLDGG